MAPGSNSSGPSSWSLRSGGTVNPVHLPSLNSNHIKPNASWGDVHVKEMLNFLIDKLPEMGEGDFKMQVWHQVEGHLRSKFPLVEGEGFFKEQ